MKAIILAAGFGTRLRPLTEKTPKALLPVNGLPLIYYPLRLLRREGIGEVVINLYHLGDLIEKELGDGKKLGMKITYSWEDQILGTGGGIKKSASYLNDTPLLVFNSDVLIDLSIKDLVKFHRQQKALATMVVMPRVPGSEYTWLTLQKGCITEISSAQPEPQKTYHYTGVQIIETPSPESGLLKYLPDGFSCIIQEGYQTALRKKQKIAGYVHNGYWSDIGTPERLKEADQDLKSGRVSLSYQE